MVCAFMDKNGTAVARIVCACSVTVLIETVHCSTAVVWGQNWNFFLLLLYVPIS